MSKYTAEIKVVTMVHVVFEAEDDDSAHSLLMDAETTIPVGCHVIDEFEDISEVELIYMLDGNGNPWRQVDM